MAGVRMLMHGTLMHDMVEMDDDLAGLYYAGMDDNVARSYNAGMDDNVGLCYGAGMDDNVAGILNVAGVRDMVEMLMYDMLVHGMVELHDVAEVPIEDQRDIGGARDVGGVLDVAEMFDMGEMGDMGDMGEMAGVNGAAEILDMGEMLDMAGVNGAAEILHIGGVLDMAGVNGAAEMLDMGEMAEVGEMAGVRGAAKILSMGEVLAPGLLVLGVPEPPNLDRVETPELGVPEPLDLYIPEPPDLGIFEPPDLYIPKPLNRYIPRQSEVLYSPEELQARDLLAETLVPPSEWPQRHPPACNGRCKGDLTGPHMCIRDSRRRLEITCRSANCSTKFPNKCAFNRHCKSVHRLGDRVDCEFVGCNRVGGEGFSRRDNMVQHMRDVHGVDAPIRRYQMRGQVQGYEH